MADASPTFEPRSDWRSSRDDDDATTSVHQLFRSAVGTVANFPAPGVQFKDISPFLSRPMALTRSADIIQDVLKDVDIDKILAVDARGFILGAVLADRLGTGFVMVRKPGKLPGPVSRFSYTCEYSSGELEVTNGTIFPGDRCLVLDDLLATGGTARATADFVKSVGGLVVGYCFMVEIVKLMGRERLADACVFSLFEC